MGRLARLTSPLGMLPVGRAAPLLAKPGVAVRTRGRAGVEQRERIRRRDRYLCRKCDERGVVRPGDEVDHRVALEDGGSDDDSNLWLLCHACHSSKSADEQRRRRSA